MSVPRTAATSLASRPAPRPRDELGEKGAGAGLAGLVGRPEQQRVDLGRRTGLDAVAGRPAGLGLVEQALAALGDAA
jgi:hypothetical protein